LNEELRRREKCIRIFPDEKSCLQLFFAILHSFPEDWISVKLYLSLIANGKNQRNPEKGYII